MDDNNKNSDSKASYDALRSMFLHPPVYLPPPLGQSLEGLVPGVLPGQGAASNLMFGHPFAPGLPMLPYRDFAYLPFPAAAAAMEGNRSGQSPTDGAAAASAANFWTGLYPFMADPFLAEAMKMNLSPYLQNSAGNDRKSSSSKEVKKSSSPKTEVKDLKRKPERSSSTHSDGSSGSHDRQTPGAKSPATRTASPHRKEERSIGSHGPPPLIKTPPLAHERKRPKLDSSLDEALDFSSKPKLLDSKRSLLPNRDDRDKREREKTRSTPNFGDVEWLSNPDSSPKKERDGKQADLFNSDPRSVLRGEALQVRIAQYNVTQLRSKLDLDDDNNWTARIEPEFSDLGQYKSKIDRNETLSAFERVDQKLGRDSVIVSRSEPKSFSERMSAIARRHAAANDLKDSGLDLRGIGKPTLDLRGLTSPMTSSVPSYPRELDLKLPRSEPSKDEIKKENESLTLKDSVDNILDSILNTYQDKPDEDSKHSNDHSADADKDTTQIAKQEDTKIECEDKLTDDKPPVDITGSTPTKPPIDTMSGGEMHGLTTSFLPLSEVLSTAINSEFARSQTSSIPTSMNIPNHLFSQGSREDSPHMAIENIIDRLEQEDNEDDEDSREPGDTSVSGDGKGLGGLSVGTIASLGDQKDISIGAYRGPNIGDGGNGMFVGFNPSINESKINSSRPVTQELGSDFLSNSTSNSAHSPGESKPCSSVNMESKHTIDPLKNGDEKTKLVLIKDSRNGYAVKSKDGIMRGPDEFSEGINEGLITPAVVEKVVNSVMLHGEESENGLFKVPDVTS